MSEEQDLTRQIAQRLFGFRVSAGVQGFTRWTDAEGTVHHAIPAYLTNPAATALVWRWLETRGIVLGAVYFDYTFEEPLAVVCVVRLGRHTAEEPGTTWQEALCRAALALAEVLDKGEGGA